MSLCRAAAVLTMFASTAFAESMPRLHTEGVKIVDDQRRPVTLRGVNLGNWLLIEPGVFNGAIGPFDDQDTLFQVLRDRFGETERRRLIDVYRDHFITARDFDHVKAFDFNIVRVGIDYELLEDDAAPMTLRPDAFKYLDFTVAEAKRRGIYVLFDLHGAPGRTVNGKQSGRRGPAEFWENRVYQDRALWLWSQIAKRYRGETTIFGYEALNEPWGKSPEALKAFCAEWYQRVRPIDPEAILVMPGWSNDFRFYGKPADNGWTNVAFDMHFYPGLFGKQKPTLEAHQRYLYRVIPSHEKVAREFDAPLFIGETNVVHKNLGGGEMMRRYYDYAAEHHMPITYWTLKELRPQGGIHEAMWMLTKNEDELPRIDIRKSSKEEIETYFRSLSTMKLVVDEDQKHWLTTNQKPSVLPPSTRPTTTTTTTTAPTSRQGQ